MSMSRRDFLLGAAAGAAACALPLGSSAQEAYGGFRMGMQTYTLRDYTFEQALGILKDLGVKYAEFIGGKHLPVTDDKAKINDAKEKLQTAGVQILSWGVQGFSKNTDNTKKAFDFAKAMGFSVYSASPSADSFESLATLTKEYGIKIAIHNHGPDDKTYGRLEQVMKAVEKWPVEIGACVDTGHVLRAGEDPVQWIKTLGPRVHDVHLKDYVGPRGEDERTLGKGKLDLVATLKALKDVNFSGNLALEYELNGPKLLDDLKVCLAAVREAAQKL